MCLILSLGCCGCSSPKPCHKNSKKQQQKQQQQEQHLQHQPKNYHSDIQLNELSPELSSINCQDRHVEHPELMGRRGGALRYGGLRQSHAHPLDSLVAQRCRR
ncbi:uncharacterized protein [Drosophila takahashii]|uniref:uncharacterized protein isoform X1 n=1 Tax=Drosophila takahashii TaxID=29030 RepID=UPI0038990D2A